MRLSEVRALFERISLRQCKWSQTLSNLSFPPVTTALSMLEMCQAPCLFRSVQLITQAKLRFIPSVTHFGSSLHHSSLYPNLAISYRSFLWLSYSVKVINVCHSENSCLLTSLPCTRLWPVRRRVISLERNQVQSQMIRDTNPWKNCIKSFVQVDLRVSGYDSSNFWSHLLTSLTESWCHANRSLRT